MTESELLPRKRCEEILMMAQAAAYRHGVHDVEVLLAATSEALTRFADNRIHQNVSERMTTAGIRVMIDQKTARATTNRLTREGIESAVADAIAMARASEPIPGIPELHQSRAANTVNPRYSEASAHCSPTQRAAAVAGAIAVAQAEGQTAAGIYATAEQAEAILNSRELFQYHFETLTTFSMTAMAADGSGWAKATSTVHEDVRPEALAQRAVRKAKLSRKPQTLDPGQYTVILEPAAVLDIVGQIFPDFSATALADGRSFLQHRLGEQLFGSNITIFDDAHFPLQSGAPFDGEGVPRGALTLVKHGVPLELPYSRMAALKAGVEPTGHGFPLPNELGEAPANIVIAGGSTCLDDMIRSAKYAILVTRLWYIREVEHYRKVMTGLTRDGTFLVRDGEIACGLRNFRFNQSVIDMLSNVELLSSSMRASGEESFDMVVPAMKVHGFTFTDRT